MEDFYNDGFNAGRGRNYLNAGHEYPVSDCDRYSYECGREKGERWREIDVELDRQVDRDYTNNY